MKRYFIFLLLAFFTFSTYAQVKVDVKKKVNRQANQRANNKTDQAIDKTFDKLEDGIGSLFGKKKKKKKGEAQQENTPAETSTQTSGEEFGAFTSMFPANGGVIAYPPFLDWEIPNDSEYKFTVHLEGDDWSDWLTKTTTKITNVGFSNLPTNTTNFKWQVIAEGNGQRLESPWQSFTTTDGTNGGQASTNKAPQPTEPKVIWAKFDFVPGDEVIFEDAPSVDEENGEFPSRWDLYKGGAEIGEVDGEPVIMFLNGGGSIIPYLKNSEEDYLPDVFTVEFDIWFSKGQTTSNRYFIHFRDQKNQWNKGLGDWLSVNPTGLEFANTDKRYPGTEHLNWSEEPTGKWRHISIAYTKGKFKAYMDDTRLINVPHLEGNPWGLTIRALAENMYLKNIRIAKGGVKYYDRVLSDGKIIVNGIRFDVNKATIKPESNGAINEIFELMQKQSDLNFSVEGHTDSDGDDALNQTLSVNRAKAVMDRLISMGISSNRLKSTGWGESKPIGENGTAEGKANNRRVEFVKF